MIDKYLYKEVYVVGTDSTVSDGGTLMVCGSLEDLMEYLRTKSIGIDYDLRVVHGVLTSAKSIPKDLKDRQAFILLVDKSADDYGIMLDSDTENNFNELGEEIEKVLVSEEIATFFYEIDNVYILYGYEMSLCLTVDEDEIDENIIEDCLVIAEQAKKLKEG